MEKSNTFNAATLGLGFHQFDGNVSVDEVLKQIGADFTVEEQSFARLPQNILDAIMRGESVTIPTEYIIGSHKATVCKEHDRTIGVVGKDYQIIQNNAGLSLMDLMTNSSVTENPLQIMSAGLVHEYEPYIQATIPMSAKINWDNSETQFYCFMHTSHDGSCGLQLRLSPVRVVCQNTFMMNIKSKGLTYKHTKNVGERVDLTKEANIKRVQEVMRSVFKASEEYIERMNSYALTKVTNNEIEEFVLKLFVDDDAIRREARLHNYNLDLVEDAKTKTKNVIKAFKDTMESGIGQDTNRGTKLWLFNATTNYLSNVASYGAKADNGYTRATKRFDAMLDGKANKRMERAMSLLA